MARLQWEGEIKCSHADIGKTLGVSKQAVQKRAAAEKWQKRMDQSRVNDRAQEAADRAFVGGGLPLATNAQSPGNQAPPVVGSSFKSDAPASLPPVSTTAVSSHVVDQLDDEFMTPEQQIEQRAIAARAEVLTRHRNELNAARNRIYEALQEKDHDIGFQKGKRAKITTEALAIVQAAERKAWGLDKPPEQGGTIIIERN